MKDSLRSELTKCCKEYYNVKNSRATPLNPEQCLKIDKTVMF